MKRLVPRGTWVGALLAALLLTFSVHAQTPTNTEPIGWVRVGALATLGPSSGSSANVQLGWSLVSPAVKPPPLLLACNTGSTNAYIQLGTSNAVVATVTVASIVVNGTCRLLALNGNSWIAGITASSSTTMTFETGTGTPMAHHHGGGSVPVNPSYLIYNSNGFILFNYAANGKTLCDAPC